MYVAPRSCNSNTLTLLHSRSVAGLGLPLVEVGALGGGAEGVGLGGRGHGVRGGSGWGGTPGPEGVSLRLRLLLPLLPSRWGLEGVGLGLRGDRLSSARFALQVLIEVLVVAAVLGSGGLAAAAAEVEAAAAAAAAAVAQGGQAAEQEQSLAPSRVDQEICVNIFFTKLFSNCKPKGSICIINITLCLIT